jgi:hypothetical protein
MRHVRSVSLIFAAVALVYSAPAFADPSGQAGATSQPAAAPVESSTDLDAVVCRQGDPPTGSRLGATRVCRTQRAWNEMEQQSQQNLGHQQMNMLTTGVKGG